MSLPPTLEDLKYARVLLAALWLATVGCLLALALHHSTHSLRLDPTARAVGGPLFPNHSTHQRCHPTQRVLAVVIITKEQEPFDATCHNML